MGVIQMKLFLALVVLSLSLNSFAEAGDGDDGDDGDSGNVGTESATTAAANSAEAAVSNFAGLPDVANFANLSEEANLGMIGPDTLAQAMETAQNNPTVMSAAETMITALESLVANLSINTGLSVSEMQSAIDGVPDDDEELAIENIIEQTGPKLPHKSPINLLAHLVPMALQNGSGNYSTQAIMDRYCPEHYTSACMNWYSTNNPNGPNWSAGGP